MLTKAGGLFVLGVTPVVPAVGADLVAQRAVQPVAGRVRAPGAAQIDAAGRTAALHGAVHKQVSGLACGCAGSRDIAGAADVVPRLKAAGVEHSVCTAKDKVDVAADRAVFVVLHGVQPGRVLPRAAEAVLLALLQGQGSGKQRVLVAIEVHILHQHAACVGVDGQRLTGLCAVPGVVLHGQVAHNGPAAAQKQRCAAEGAGLDLARPRVTPAHRRRDNCRVAVLALDDIVRQLNEGPFLVDAVPDVEPHRLVRRGRTGSNGLGQRAVVARTALVNDQCFAFRFGHAKNPLINAISLAARAGTASSRSTGRASCGSCRSMANAPA